MNRQQPKYIALAQWAREEIESKRIAHGNRFHTESALCEMFGISRQTVRQALGVLELEGYLERRRGSGTYVIWDDDAPAGKSRVIGVIITFTDDYIFPSIIRGIEQVLSRNHYTMQLVFTHNRVENERRALLGMLGQNVDGLLVEPTKSALPNPNLDLYRRLAGAGAPVVFFNSHYPGTPYPHVSLDDRAAGRLATEYAVSQGHRRIAGLFKSDDQQGHLRYAGYLEALMRHNLEMRADSVIWYATEDIPHLFADQSRGVVDRLGDCTALVCYNDDRAAQLLPVLKERGIRVPEDLSVVSVDDSPFSAMTEPPLTTVIHPKEQLGETAAKHLLEILRDATFDATVNFEAKLRERSSVARWNALDRGDM